MKTALLLMVISFNLFAQGSGDFCAYGNIGFGLSRGEYKESRGGTVARMGLTVGYSHFLIKIDRTVNNEYQALIPPEKVTSNALLFGLAFQPFRNLSEVWLTGKYGFGKGETIKRGKIIVYKLFNDEYELYSEKYSTNILEIDMELRLKNVGIYVGGFYESLPRNKNYGATFGAIFGYF